MIRTYGAVVGRFQVHKLHKGHVKLLNFAQRNHDNLIVFIGDRADTPPTPTNPLSFKLREAMVRKKYPHAIICRLVDQHQNHVWTNNLDSMVDDITNGAGVTFYCGRDSFAPYYTGKHKIVTKNFNCDDVCASIVRDTLKNTAYDNEKFRAGVIHAMQNMWHRTYHTVDMALFRRDDAHRLQICLVRKPNETLWQLPGGFVDKGEKFAAAAKREMIEETGLAVDGWHFINDFMISDWRIRGVRGVDHKTVLMGAYTNSEKEPVGSDDIEEARFFSFHLVVNNLDEWVRPSHHSLLESLQDGVDFIV